MIGIVIVSHSARLAEGVKELADGMTRGAVPIAVAAGGPDGSLGTSAERIREAIDAVYTPEGVLILMDLGSAVMSAELARDLLEPERASRVRLSDAPLVEGAVVAAVEASLRKSLVEVDAAAVVACRMQKVER